MREGHSTTTLRHKYDYACLGLCLEVVYYYSVKYRAEIMRQYFMITSCVSCICFEIMY